MESKCNSCKNKTWSFTYEDELEHQIEVQTNWCKENQAYFGVNNNVVILECDQYEANPV